MNIDKQGWIDAAERKPSPNCDARPCADDISLIVVHGISLPPGEFGGDGVDELFQNRLDPEEHPYYREIGGLRVSAHLIARRDGRLTQYVSLLERAWHAGPSEFEGRAACNDYSIGIELEGSDDVPYTDAQYRVLGQLCVLIRQRYPAITRRRIVGHSDIAPGRKTDPGAAFSWQALDVEIDKFFSESGIA